MKFFLATVMGLLLAEQTAAFVPQSPLARRANTGSSRRLMAAADMPPATQSGISVVQAPPSQYGPADVRYSDFLKLVNAKRIEKVTFSSDGTQLLGVDVDGARLKIEALPNDPSFLTELTSHDVRIRLFFSYILVIVLHLVASSSIVRCPSLTRFLLHHIYFRLMSLFSPNRKPVA